MAVSTHRGGREGLVVVIPRNGRCVVLVLIALGLVLVRVIVVSVAGPDLRAAGARALAAEAEAPALALLLLDAALPVPCNTGLGTVPAAHASPSAPMMGALHLHNPQRAPPPA